VFQLLVMLRASEAVHTRRKILGRPALTVAAGTAEAAKAHIAAVSERVRLINRQLKEVSARDRPLSTRG